LIEELRWQPWAHKHKVNITVTNGVVDLWALSNPKRAAGGDDRRRSSISGVAAVDDHLMRDPAFVY
jgi:hypothetical protein